MRKLHIYHKEFLAIYGQLTHQQASPSRQDTFASHQADFLPGDLQMWVVHVVSK